MRGIAVSESVRIKIFVESNGRYEEADEEYGLSEIGLVPQVGDLFVNPGVVEGRDRNDPRNREVGTVTKRYVHPMRGPSNETYICLVLDTRPGQENEINIL